MIYADVIVPLPLQGFFTYTVPSDILSKIKIGSRVIIQFGKKKYYTAIVFNLYQESDEGKDIKEIISLLDDEPIVLAQQLKFWQWISFYYMCTIGEVYKAALPSALKLESETHVYKNPDFESDEPFSLNEEKIFHILSETKPLKLSELEKLTKIKNIPSYIKSLSEKKAVLINENIKNKYAIKTETVISLAKDFTDEELTDILESLKRAKKQQQLLINFLSEREMSNSTERFYISKKELLEKYKTSSSILDALIERNILKPIFLEKSRFDYGNSESKAEKKLNTDQQKAFDEINGKFESNSTVLLHGVTSSGKTEIYIKLIKEAVETGKQVLYLLPEIALTTQITDRLKRVFGDNLSVFHSKFNDNERAEIWNNLIGENPKQVILGARSSIFLPFQNLGLIIVDEEHETSYKQQEPAPRYNARDAAIYLAHLYNAKVLLGTATPSIETYYNASVGKYGLVELLKRYENIELPQIDIINIKELRRKKQMKSALSPDLIEKTNTALSKKEQVILFQNRRGFAPLIECKSCAWTPKCDHCDVNLTYHKWQHILLCHYCGATYSLPEKCPVCGSAELEITGYGTERIEEEVSNLFPENKSLRMDFDTTRSKNAYSKIISDFAGRKADILIGTQMVSKGLDFENVSVVGILNADGMLNYPDFRAHERAFQMMTQVSGRAGRKNKQGTVVLQTSQPNHPVIDFVRNNNYQGMYELQIDERKLFHYPPFYRLISIIIRSKDENILHQKSERFAALLQQSFGDKILGPTRPAVARIQTLHIRKILIKTDAKDSPQKVRDAIGYYKNILLNEPESNSLLIHYDVDPI